MMTLTIPEPLAVLLEQRAEHLQVPVEELGIRLLAESLHNGITTVTDNGVEEELPSLEETIAQIKAKPRKPTAVHRGSRVGDIEYIDYLLANPPQDTMTMEEWEEFWPKFEQELKEMAWKRELKNQQAFQHLYE